MQRSRRRRRRHQQPSPPSAGARRPEALPRAPRRAGGAANGRGRTAARAPQGQALRTARGRGLAARGRGLEGAAQARVGLRRRGKGLSGSRLGADAEDCGNGEDSAARARFLSGGETSLGSGKCRSATLGYTRLLSAPLGSGRRRSAALGCARLLSAPRGCAQSARPGERLKLPFLPGTSSRRGHHRLQM